MAKFQKGQSGNPAGRKAGVKDKRTELREFLRPHSRLLVATAVALALRGDVAALKLCIDRLMPPLRPQREPVKIATKGSLGEQAGQLFQAAASGAIGADVAADLVGILTAQARIIEVSELVERLEALEARQSELSGLLERK